MGLRCVQWRMLSGHVGILESVKSSDAALKNQKEMPNRV